MKLIIYLKSTNQVTHIPVLRTTFHNKQMMGLWYSHSFNCETCLAASPVALGLNDVVNSISHLSSIVQSNMKSVKLFPKSQVILRMWLKTSDDNNEREEGSSSELEEEDESRFGFAFSKGKTSANVNSSLASMFNQACKSPAYVA